VLTALGSTGVGGRSLNDAQQPQESQAFAGDGGEGVASTALPAEGQLGRCLGSHRDRALRPEGRNPIASSLLDTEPLPKLPFNPPVGRLSI
jgi:hypothetical protein